MPLQDSRNIDTYESDYDFNEALVELQDFLREKHPDLSATFNQEQASFLAAILNDVHYLHTVGEKATAADVTRVLYQEIRHEGERKNAAMDIVSTLHKIPTKANTTRLIHDKEESKALGITHKAAQDKHTINFGKILIGTFISTNICFIATIGIPPLPFALIFNIALPAAFSLLVGGSYVATSRDSFLKKHAGKDSQAYKDAISKADISTKAAESHERQLTPFREDFEAKANRFFEPNLGKRNQPPIKFTPL